MTSKLLLTGSRKLLLFNGSLVTFPKRKDGLGPSHSAQTSVSLLRAASALEENEFNHSCGSGFPNQSPSLRVPNHSAAIFPHFFPWYYN